MQLHEQGGVEVMQKIQGYSDEIEKLRKRYEEKKEEMEKLQIDRDEVIKLHVLKYYHDVVDGVRSEAAYKRIEEKQCRIVDIKIRGVKKEIAIINRNWDAAKEQINLWKKANFTV